MFSNPKFNNVKYKYAFTLAEVLITLGIIGIVAALTIPTLTNNTNDQALRSAAKKTYSGLTQATNLLINDNSGDIWTEVSGNNVASAVGMKDNYKTYFNMVSENNTPTLIFKSTYKNYQNTTTAFYSSWPAISLSDGQLMQFIDLTANSCGGTMQQWNAAATGPANVCGEIIVDTNGNNAPNMWGKDMIAFWIIRPSAGAYKVIPFGAGTDGFTCSKTSCDAWSQVCGVGCSYNMLNDIALP